MSKILYFKMFELQFETQFIEKITFRKTKEIREI